MAFIPNYKAKSNATTNTTANKPNGSSDPFYRKNKWRVKSEAQRNKEPYCRQCNFNGYTTLGNVADHIIPISQGGAKFDDRNLQTLCNKCHNIKRKKEAMGIYPPFVMSEFDEKIPAL